MKSSARLQRNNEFLESLKRRHDKVCNAIKDSAAIFVSLDQSSNPAARRVGYRTSSTFHYLTGLNEPEAVVVFSPMHPAHKRVLFLRERDSFTELWNGPMLGVAGAVDVLGFDAAFPISQLSEKLPEYLKGARSFYWDNNPSLPYSNSLKQLIESSFTRIRGATLNTDTEALISEFRLIKDDWEVAQQQHASDISSRAFEHAMRFSKPGLFEYQVQAALEEKMLAAGSKWRGYESIVASGPNACCLHYCVNQSKLDSGDLLLIDAGTEVNGYTADITRTFPVGADFSPEQRLIYEMVLATQKDIISIIKPGVPYYKLSQMMIDLLTEKLAAEKIVKPSLTELRESRQTRNRYIPHNSGHFLGLDVHDVGRLLDANESWSQEKPVGRPLEAGMALTVEPGLYFHPDDETVDARFRGIGIRIEDDILVTANGHHNFTTCAKEVDAIKALKQG